MPRAWEHPKLSSLRDDSDTGTLRWSSTSHQYWAGLARSETSPPRSWKLHLSPSYCLQLAQAPPWPPLPWASCLLPPYPAQGVQTRLQSQSPPPFFAGKALGPGVPARNPARFPNQQRVLGSGVWCRLVDPFRQHCARWPGHSVEAVTVKKQVTLSRVLDNARKAAQTHPNPATAQGVNGVGLTISNAQIASKQLLTWSDFMAARPSTTGDRLTVNLAVLLPLQRSVTTSNFFVDEQPNLHLFSKPNSDSRALCACSYQRASHQQISPRVCMSVCPSMFWIAIWYFTGLANVLRSSPIFGDSILEAQRFDPIGEGLTK